MPLHTLVFKIITAHFQQALEMADPFNSAHTMLQHRACAAKVRSHIMTYLQFPLFIPDSVLLALIANFISPGMKLLSVFVRSCCEHSICYWSSSLCVHSTLLLRVCRQSTSYWFCLHLCLCLLWGVHWLDVSVSMVTYSSITSFHSLLSLLCTTIGLFMKSFL